MAKNIFAGIHISTLNNLRQLVSSFPKGSNSVAVVSERRILTQWHLWATTLSRVKPYYAVKCNPDRTLLRSLYENGVSFDCASLREVFDIKTMSLNLSIPDILYAHPLKSSYDIRMIGEKGIKRTVVDSVEECIKLYEHDWNGSALLRIAVNDKGSKMPFSVKFGAEERELEKIIRSSKIPLTGVSFHVGSGCQNPLQYKEAIENSYRNVFTIMKIFGHTPNTLDIGGGFSFLPSEFLKSAEVIQDAIQEIPCDISIISEPGRFFAQPSQDLFVKIIAKKPGSGGRGWRYVLDESLYGQFSCIQYDHQKPAFFRIPKENDFRERSINESILFGRTCDSLDVIAKGPLEELYVGDWLYFPFMGAYTSATASEFNGFPKPSLVQDTKNLLPDTYDLSKEVTLFHEKNSKLTYSNTLTPIV
jgi:ornithine decarboxylase